MRGQMRPSLYGIMYFIKENYPLESQSLGKLHLRFTTIITSTLQSVRKQRTESMKMKHIKKIQLKDHSRLQRTVIAAAALQHYTGVLVELTIEEPEHGHLRSVRPSTHTNTIIDVGSSWFILHFIIIKKQTLSELVVH